VDEIPSFAKQRPKLPTVCPEMGLRSKPHIERRQPARFVGNRFELDVAKVTAKPGRRGGGDLPRAGTRQGHLVRQPAILGHDVGVTDRQQPLQSTLRPGNVPSATFGR
jgi:hypothetical protein